MRKHRPWSVRDRKFLIDNYQKHKNSDLATMLGRTYSSIQSNAKIYKLKKYPKDD